MGSYDATDGQSLGFEVWFVPLVAVSLVPSAWASTEQINAFRRIATSIVHCGRPRQVEVLNFAEPDGSVIPLAQIELADDSSVCHLRVK